MKLIKLTQGKFAKVDDADYEWLNQWKWCAAFQDKFYAIRHESVSRKSIRMHRLILGVTDSNIKVDHKDGDSLNNQRSNLRLANDAQNSYNRKAVRGASKYKGVVLWKGVSRGIKYSYWKSTITCNGKRIILCHKPPTPYGERAAAKKYDEAARKYFGEYAYLNFP